jgi:5-methylcytosine-specific restriction endonuclease McrA
MMFDYNSQKWKRKRLQILKRDGYMCQHCKRYGKAVPATTVHHIKHADEYPEMAFADKNLISLCEGCHNKQHPGKAAAARGRY